MKPDHNLHPHAEAVLAMTIWGYEYSRQSGGCMDFWDALPGYRKHIVRSTLDRIQTIQRAQPQSSETERAR